MACGVCCEWRGGEHSSNLVTDVAHSSDDRTHMMIVLKFIIHVCLYGARGTTPGHVCGQSLHDGGAGVGAIPTAATLTSSYPNEQLFRRTGAACALHPIVRSSVVHRRLLRLELREILAEARLLLLRRAELFG